MLEKVLQQLTLATVNSSDIWRVMLKLHYFLTQPDLIPTLSMTVCKFADEPYHTKVLERYCYWITWYWRHLPILGRIGIEQYFYRL